MKLRHDIPVSTILNAFQEQGISVELIFRVAGVHHGAIKVTKNTKNEEIQNLIDQTTRWSAEKLGVIESFETYRANAIRDFEQKLNWKSDAPGE